MGLDMTVPIGDGVINLRVGAIIMQNGRLLMVGNETADYLYSVGGRIQFGETAEEAVIREVLEETGVRMEIDRLGFIHENYFTGDSGRMLGKPVYEVSFFFYMKVPDGFHPACSSFTEYDSPERLVWISPDTEQKYFPAFFRTELLHPVEGVRHIVTNELRDAVSECVRFKAGNSPLALANEEFAGCRKT